MSKLTLILGGARSGKSSYAERLARKNGRNSVLYVATAEARDDEMQERITTHRQNRPVSWRTMETPRHVGLHLLQERPPERIVLLDCLTLLVSNILTAAEDIDLVEAETQVQAEIEQLIACPQQLSLHLIVVSNEVGLGLVPTTSLGRAYRDVLGRANQMLAAAADEVYFLVAGIPMTIKG